MLGRILRLVFPRKDYITGLLRLAALLTMLGLALMLWSVFQPTPLPVMLAMSVGQGIGTSALGCYLLAVWLDLRRIRRVRRESLPPPTGEPR